MQIVSWYYHIFCLCTIIIPQLTEVLGRSYTNKLVFSTMVRPEYFLYFASSLERLEVALTGVLSELFEVGDVDDVRRQAGVCLRQTDAAVAGGRCSSLVLETLLDVAAHLSGVGPPVAQIILPFPNHRHRLRLSWNSRGGRW